MTIAAEIHVGDVIAPPARELRLWMRRDVENGSMSPDALRIAVTEIYPAEDKGGTWLVIRGNDCTERRTPWSLRARPATPWPILTQAPR
jgi:hypothetical protein